MKKLPLFHWRIRNEGGRKKIGQTVLMWDPNPQVPHLSYSFFPAADDLLVSDLKSKRLSPRPRRVEHLSVCQGACGRKPRKREKYRGFTGLCVSHRAQLKWKTPSGTKSAPLSPRSLTVPVDPELCLLGNFSKYPSLAKLNASQMNWHCCVQPRNAIAVPWEPDSPLLMIDRWLKWIVAPPWEKSYIVSESGTAPFWKYGSHIHTILASRLHQVPKLFVMILYTDLFLFLCAGRRGGGGSLISFVSILLLYWLFFF